MKVPISQYERLKLDAPVLGAVERFHGGRRRFWVYGPHCKVEHVHGPMEGHREAHCVDDSSPYWTSGYKHRIRKSIHMTLSATPESIVQRQLDAFNARDIEALMATYAEDAQQFEHPATPLASGAAQLRERSTSRFQEPNLHARLIKRIVMGNVVIDHEEVTRTFVEGPGKIELVAIYEVRDGRIATAWFIYGAKTLDSRS